MAVDDRAVVVGICTYPELGDLSGPENDAHEFADWLWAKDGGDLPTENVKLILSSGYKKSRNRLRTKPTSVELVEAFDELHELGDQHGGRAGRRLYIYLAGHGIAPKVEETALLMANAARRRRHHFAGRSYAEWFRRAAFFSEVVLLMDCCRENYPRTTLSEPDYDTMTSRNMARYFYGFATEWSRASREGPYGPKGEVRGLFTLALLAGLRNAPRNQAGELTGSLLGDFIYNYIQDRWGDRAATEGAQEPEFFYGKRRDIVFTVTTSTATKPTSPPPMWTVRVTLSRANAGSALELVGGDRQLIPAARVAGNRWEWEGLPQGIYRFRLSGEPSEFFELIGESGSHDVRL
jgi:hypothetical protein